MCSQDQSGHQTTTPAVHSRTILHRSNQTAMPSEKPNISTLDSIAKKSSV